MMLGILMSFWGVSAYFQGAFVGVSFTVCRSFMGFRFPDSPGLVIMEMKHIRHMQDGPL